MFVTAIISPSPAFTAGVKPGDEILQVNGVVAKEAAEDKLKAELSKPEGSSITLLLQRTGEEKPREVTLPIRKSF